MGDCGEGGGLGLILLQGAVTTMLFPPRPQLGLAGRGRPLFHGPSQHLPPSPTLAPSGSTHLWVPSSLHGSVNMPAFLREPAVERPQAKDHEGRVGASRAGR